MRKLTLQQLLFALVALLLLAIPQAITAENTRQLAFPGADGYGKYVTGGRGGEVCYVTRLDDCSDANLVEGTLRWALRHDNGGRPRTVLFNVAGTIYLTSKLKLQYPDVSILGQSAPGGGICISGYNLYICRNNVIVRYIRFRAGDIPNSSMTGLDIENCDRVILDHCSMTWSMEECLTAYDTDSTTVQWCIIGEGLYSSKNAKGARAYATQWGGEHSTMHHSLITNSHSRSPRFNGVRNRSNNFGDHDYQVDSEFANNVVFNWSGTGAIYGGEYDKSTVETSGTWTDGIKGYNRVYMLNNYYRPGPSTKSNNTDAYFASPSSPFGEWYANGNKFEESSAYTPWAASKAQSVNADNSLAMRSLPAANLLSALPYALSGMEYESADAAFKSVTSKAGASLPRYDEVDRRLLDEAAGVRNPQFTGSLGELGIIDAPDNIALSDPGVYYADGIAYHNYPSLALKAGEKYIIDSDCDGLPDAYEDAMGFDKNDAGDGAALASNGYTNLENYLNAIADGTLQKSAYETSPVPVKPGTSVVPSQVSVTYSCSDSSVMGSLPASVTVPYGETVTIPANTSLYKEGYTLSGWQGNGYMLGAENEVMPMEDLVLTPVFVKNAVNIPDRTASVVAIVKDFYSTSAEITVTQTVVEGKKIDYAVSSTGTPLNVGSGYTASQRGNDLVIYYPYHKSSGGISGSGDATVAWAWNTGALVEKGECTPDAAFASATASLKGTLSFVAKSVSGKKAVGVQPAAKLSSRGTDYIEYKVTPVAGLKFTPTNLSFNAARCGTDGGYVDVTYVLDGKETTLQSKDSFTRDALSAVSLPLTVSATENPFLLRFYVYNLANNKQVVFNDIKVQGVYEGESAPTTQVCVTALPYEEGRGSITLTPEAESYDAGKDVTLTATPATGCIFEKWLDANGNTLSVNPVMTVTADKDLLFFAVMKAESDYDHIFNNEVYDAEVTNAVELSLALKAAQNRSDKSARYRIFLHNGVYDFGTKALTAVEENTSLVGESQEGVLVMNNPGAVTNYQQDTPVLFIDQNKNNVYMQDLTIRQNRDWESKKSAGQCIALRQRGKFAAYKNVTIQGVQDTYYLNKADASAYFEDCTIAGEVDFIYGDGTMFFQNCCLNPISQNAVITASNAQAGYKGIVFNDCEIDGASGYALGRPWGDSPAATYINTTMRQLPSETGWKSMTSGLVVRFHEYGSKSADGALLDLSKRSIAACGAAAGSDPCVIDASAAAEYTLEKTFEKWSEWSPASATRQIAMPQPALTGNQLTWQAAEGAIGYAVCKDGKVVGFTKGTEFAVDDATATYTVRAANEMGGLGTTASFLPGDADSDGSVTMADANMVVNHYLGVPTEGINLQAVDMDSDGSITMSDANSIVNIYLGE